LTNRKFDVVIVGGGFSGTMMAVQLLRRASDLDVALIDKSSSPGRGVAYGTKHSCHLLNVPAGKMSALPDDAGHFLRWARENYSPAVEDGTFLARAVYGQYVGGLLDEARSRPNRLQWIEDEVLSIQRDAGHVLAHLKTGASLSASAVVLATGNFPPANPRIPGFSENQKRYVPYAWSADALEGLPADGSVLLMGSGLTSLDLVIALKSKGFAGSIHVISRRGLLPQVHQQTKPWPQFWDEHSPRSARGLLRLIRNQVLAASQAGVDWRAVIDALRPVTQNIWRSLPVQEQRRFLRHLRSYWEVHRHRIAPEQGKLLAHLIQQGQLQMYSGRVTHYREVGQLAEVTIRNRLAIEQKLSVNRMINCTGSETDCRRIDDPLITNLFAQGLARPDALSLGLDVDENGAVFELTSTRSDFLYALGPVRKGCLWETTAVPEIRVQAAQLAEHLLNRSRRRTSAGTSGKSAHRS